ncbi:MAG TPA: lipase maturation factor family protein [Chthoniobacteraceae bacterium]|nr:lipase maturation factor family protein [Chthoniobacteraceae bacterium]
MRGLIGARGISPAAEFLEMARKQLGGGAWLEVPTFCWWNVSDGFLVALCVAGCAVSAIMIAGFAPGACSLALWAMYLSLCSVGSPFLNFQWDALLLETGLLAVFYLPWKVRPDWTRESRVSWLARWLLWWLLFRLMFASGVVKLSSGDETWHTLTALRVHFETQPLPLPTAWFAHNLPWPVLRVLEAGMFAIELVAPFLIFAPRRLRHIGGLALIALQLGIMFTGNYAFFNLLSIALCLLLFDDDAWPQRWRARFQPDESAPPAATWPLWIFGPVAGGIAMIGMMNLVAAFRTGVRWPEPFASLRDALAPLESFNGYGLFAVMTTTRPEIFVEGSDDGVNWQAYRFRWKPGNVRDAPTIVAPHQPRLDWQMWFAALSDYRQEPWFVRFLARLLEGSPEVLDLLEWNPFPSHPPRFVRAVVYEYHFTHWGESAWWSRGEEKLYCPAISLRSEER